VRLLLLPALLASLVLAAGCADDEAPIPPAGAGAAGPTYTLAEAEGRLEGAGLELVRDGDEAPTATLVDPEPAVSQRFAAQNGTEFDLLVYATPEQAKQALASVFQTDVVREGGAYTRAANLVAVTPDTPRDSDAFKVVFRLFDSLSGREDDADLSGRLTATELARLGEQAIGRAVAVTGSAGQVLPSGGPPLAFFLGGANPGPRLLVIPRDPSILPEALVREPLPGRRRPRLRVKGVVRPVSAVGAVLPDGADRSFLDARAGSVVLIAETVEPA